MPSRFKIILSSLLVIVAYCVVGTFGLKLALVHVSATAVWLPTGIAFAALLWLGYRAWPLVAVSAFLVNVNNAASLSLSAITSSAGIACGNTLEALAAAYLIRRLAGGAGAFDYPSRVFFFVFAVLLACVVGASIGVLALAVTDFGNVSHPFPIWLTWWLGDAIGAIIGCPLIILWLRPRPFAWRLPVVIEAALLALSTFAAGFLVFENGFGLSDHFPLEFVCPPIVLWAALRFGRRETVLVNFVLLGIAMHGSLNGHGPFVLTDRNESLILLQSYMAVTAITGLVVAAVVDERKRLQQELVMRAEDLDRSNKELEQYAYVASHDLKEPLRMISSYSHLLSQRYRDKLDDKANGFLDYIERNVHRMQEFIDGILEFSRISGTQASNETVSLDAMLKESLSYMEGTIAKTQAQVTSDPLPSISCNRMEIRQLLQNLIGNALKFRGEAPPRVHIGARRSDHEWIVSVSDNGIGIDPQHAARLFEMFYRLHSAAQYPGSGIGLAVCKKIVERHGGRIWFESKPGAGTTFYFSLPISPS